MNQQTLFKKSELFMVLHGHDRVWGCWTEEGGKKHCKRCGGGLCIPPDKKYYYTGKNKKDGHDYTICVEWLDDE